MLNTVKIFVIANLLPFLYRVVEEEMVRQEIPDRLENK